MRARTRTCTHITHITLPIPSELPASQTPAALASIATASNGVWRDGVLPLPEGTTLRTFLSGQLHVRARRARRPRRRPR